MSEEEKKLETNIFYQLDYILKIYNERIYDQYKTLKEDSNKDINPSIIATADTLLKYRNRLAEAISKIPNQATQKGGKE